MSEGPHGPCRWWVCAHSSTNPAKGRPLIDESMAVARQAGDRWCLTGSLTLLGVIEAFRGDVVATRAVNRQVIPQGVRQSIPHPGLC